MDEAKKPDANSAALNEKMLLARILLNRFGTLHEFHEAQLNKYPLACCKISLGGESELDADTKTITYRIFTERFYKLHKGGVVPKSSFEKFISKFKIPDKKYDIERKQALVNLTDWSKTLLWGEITKVKLVVDGTECGG